MIDFDYITVKNIESFLEIALKHKDQMKILAGGTDIIPNLKKRKISPQLLVNIKKLSPLMKCKLTDTFKLGPLLKISEIRGSEDVQNHLPLLHSASCHLGSPLIRNLATLGGNICSASPAADMVPALLCYEAKINTISPLGEKQYNILDFFQGPGLTVLEKNELVTEFEIHLRPGTYTDFFIKHGYRKALEISIVNAATLISLDNNHNINDIKIAIGSVGPCVIRLKEAEQLIINQRKITKNLLIKVGEIAATQSSPISDLRASADYRTRVLKDIVQRVILNALEKKGVSCSV